MKKIIIKNILYFQWIDLVLIELIAYIKLLTRVRKRERGKMDTRIATNGPR